MALDTQFPTHILRERSKADPAGAFQRSFLQSKQIAARQQEQQQEQEFKLAQSALRQNELNLKQQKVSEIFSGAQSFEEILDRSAQNPWLYYDKDTGPGMARMMQTFTSLKRAENTTLDAKNRLKESEWYRGSLDSIAAKSMHRAASIRALPKTNNEGYLTPEVVSAIDEARFDLNLEDTTRPFAPSEHEREFDFIKRLESSGDPEDTQLAGALRTRLERGNTSQRMSPEDLIEYRSLVKQRDEIDASLSDSSTKADKQLDLVNQRGRLNKLMEKLRSRTAAPTTTPAAPQSPALTPAAPTDQKVLRYNPASGRIE